MLLVPEEANQKPYVAIIKVLSPSVTLGLSTTFHDVIYCVCMNLMTLWCSFTVFFLIIM